MHSFIFLRIPDLPPPPPPKEDKPTNQKHIWVQQQSINVQLQLDGPKSQELDCDDSYIGVGLGYWLGWITDVAKGGPADLAGVEVNDVWLNWKEYDTRTMEMGDFIDMHIKKPNGTIKKVKINVDKICKAEVE